MSTVSSLETSWFDCTFDNNTDTPFNKEDVTCNSLLFENIKSSQETTWIDCTLDNNTAEIWKKVDNTCNNLLIDPTVSS